MKKLIAIAVVFVLVAGAAFAELNLGGSVDGKVVLVKDEGKGITHESSTGFGLSASGQNENGTFGGEFAFGGGWRDVNGNAFANVWWKPIEQVKVQIGTGQWGALDEAGAFGWGFYEGINDLIGSVDPISGIKGDLPGTPGIGWGPALILSVYPVSGLEINLAVPYATDGLKGNKNVPADVFTQTLAKVSYSIDGIGKIILAFKGGYNDFTVGDPHRASIGFDLSAVENLGVFLAATFGFPLVNESVNAANVKTTTTKYDAVNVALSVKYSAGAFGIKFRFGSELGKGAQKVEVSSGTGGSESKGSSTLRFGLYPTYQINESVFAGLGFDMKVSGITDGGADPVVGWYVSPHLAYNVPGGGTFQIGAEFGQAKKDGDIGYGFPIRLAYSF